MGWRAHGLTGGLADWLAKWLADWMTDWLADGLTYWLTGGVAGWLTGWLIDWVSEWTDDRFWKLNLLAKRTFSFSTEDYRVILANTNCTTWPLLNNENDTLPIHHLPLNWGFALSCAMINRVCLAAFSRSKDFLRVTMPVSESTAKRSVLSLVTVCKMEYVTRPFSPLSSSVAASSFKLESTAA